MHLPGPHRPDLMLKLTIAAAGWMDGAHGPDLAREPDFADPWFRICPSLPTTSI